MLYSAPTPSSRLVTLQAFLYIGFAAVVFWLHGPQPSLSIDHIAYFKLSDEIAAQHTDGAYWHSISSVRTYGVILAYLHAMTQDHVASLKWILAGLTIAYLFGSCYFFRAFVPPGLAIIMALLSAIHVSFGTVFWGMTDFSASLNRSLAIPPMMFLLGWYFRNHDSPKRMVAYPILILLSILHLGTYHLLALLVSLDGLRLLGDILGKSTETRAHSRNYSVALASIGVAYFSLAIAGLNSTSLTTLLPRVDFASPTKSTSNEPPPTTANLDMPKKSSDALATRPETATNTRPTSSDQTNEVSKNPPASPVIVKYSAQDLERYLKAPAWENALSSSDAWLMEAKAQPWRLFPPPPATILGALSSIFFLGIASLTCGYQSIIRSGMSSLDRLMILFSGCVLFGSYGLQFSQWITRQFLPIYPMNFEEVRMISFLIIPMLYFSAKGLHTLWKGANLHPPRRLFAAILFGFLLVQPIYIIRLLPASLREWSYAALIDRGLLGAHTSQRNSFVRGYLHLAGHQEHLYYPVIPIAAWLKATVRPTDIILTNRDDLYMLTAQVLGTSNGFLNTSSSSLRRVAWSEIYERLDIAIQRRDLAVVYSLARDCDAHYAVVPWAVPDAAFQANGFSIVKMHNGQYEQ